MRSGLRPRAFDNEKRKDMRSYKSLTNEEKDAIYGLICYILGVETDISLERNDGSIKAVNGLSDYMDIDILEDFARISRIYDLYTYITIEDGRLVFVFE